MPLRIMQPPQPAISYQSGGNNRNQVQMAFGNQMNAADRKALALREEELAFQKDLADRKFSFESKNADRTYDETVRSNKQQEAFRQQEIANTKSYYEQQSPMNQSKARNWEVEQAEKRNLHKVGAFLNIPESERTYENVYKAAMERNRMAAIYEAEVQDNLLKRQGIGQSPEAVESILADAGILPMGPVQPDETPSFLTPQIKHSLYSAKTPEEARAVADYDYPDPTDGTMVEGMSGEYLLARLADAEARKHGETFARQITQLSLEGVRKEMEAISTSFDGMAALSDSMDTATEAYLEGVTAYHEAKRASSAAAKTFQVNGPSIVKGVLDKYLKADQRPSTQEVTDKIFSDLGSISQSFGTLLKDPTQAENPEFVGAKGPALATNLVLAQTAQKMLPVEIERIKRESPQKYKELAPILESVQTRIDDVATALTPLLAQDPLFKQTIQSAVKLSAFKNNVQKVWENGSTGIVDPDFAREMVAAENAGDPQAGRRLSRAAAEEGGAYNPSIETLIPDDPAEVPLVQQLNRDLSGQNPDFLTPEEIARVGYAGVNPNDVIPWLMELGSYLPTRSRKEFYESGPVQRHLKRLEEADRKIKEQQAEMRKRSAQLDVTKYRPEGVQLKPAPARKQSQGGQPRIQQAQQTKQGYSEVR